jgi:hypothetical protein
LSSLCLWRIACSFLCSLGLNRRVDWLVEASVSGKLTVSISRTEDALSMVVRNVGSYQRIHTAI